jgi:hypothetical protein
METKMRLLFTWGFIASGVAFLTFGWLTIEQWFHDRFNA